MEENDTNEGNDISLKKQVYSKFFLSNLDLTESIRERSSLDFKTNDINNDILKYNLNSYNKSNINSFYKNYQGFYNNFFNQINESFSNKNLKVIESNKNNNMENLENISVSEMNNQNSQENFVFETSMNLKTQESLQSEKYKDIKNNINTGIYEFKIDEVTKKQVINIKKNNPKKIIQNNKEYYNEDTLLTESLYLKDDNDLNNSNIIITNFHDNKIDLLKKNNIDKENIKDFAKYGEECLSPIKKSDNINRKITNESENNHVNVLGIHTNNKFRKISDENNIKENFDNLYNNNSLKNKKQIKTIEKNTSTKNLFSNNKQEKFIAGKVIKENNLNINTQKINKDTEKNYLNLQSRKSIKKKLYNFVNHNDKKILGVNNKNKNNSYLNKNISEGSPSNRIENINESKQLEIKNKYQKILKNNKEKIEKSLNKKKFHKNLDVESEKNNYAFKIASEFNSKKNNLNSLKRTSSVQDLHSDKLKLDRFIFESKEKNENLNLYSKSLNKNQAKKIEIKKNTTELSKITEKIVYSRPDSRKSPFDSAGLNSNKEGIYSKNYKNLINNNNSNRGKYFLFLILDSKFNSNFLREKFSEQNKIIHPQFINRKAVKKYKSSQKIENKKNLNILYPEKSNSKSKTSRSINFNNKEIQKINTNIKLDKSKSFCKNEELSCRNSTNNPDLKNNNFQNENFNKEKKTFSQFSTPSPNFKIENIYNNKFNDTLENKNIRNINKNLNETPGNLTNISDLGNVADYSKINFDKKENKLLDLNHSIKNKKLIIFPKKNENESFLSKNNLQENILNLKTFNNETIQDSGKKLPIYFIPEIKNKFFKQKTLNNPKHDGINSDNLEENKKTQYKKIFTSGDRNNSPLSNNKINSLKKNIENKEKINLEPPAYTNKRISNLQNNEENKINSNNNNIIQKINIIYPLSPNNNTDSENKNTISPNKNKVFASTFNSINSINSLNSNDFQKNKSYKIIDTVHLNKFLNNRSVNNINNINNKPKTTTIANFVSISNQENLKLNLNKNEINQISNNINNNLFQNDYIENIDRNLNHPIKDLILFDNNIPIGKNKDIGNITIGSPSTNYININNFNKNFNSNKNKNLFNNNKNKNNNNNQQINSTVKLNSYNYSKIKQENNEANSSNKPKSDSSIFNSKKTTKLNENTSIENALQITQENNSKHSYEPSSNIKISSSNNNSNNNYSNNELDNSKGNLVSVNSQIKNNSPFKIDNSYNVNKNKFNQTLYNRKTNLKQNNKEGILNVSNLANKILNSNNISGNNLNNSSLGYKGIVNNNFINEKKEKNIEKKTESKDKNKVNNNGLYRLGNNPFMGSEGNLHMKTKSMDLNYKNHDRFSNNIVSNKNSYSKNQANLNEISLMNHPLEKNNSNLIISKNNIGRNNSINTKHKKNAYSHALINYAGNINNSKGKVELTHKFNKEKEKIIFNFSSNNSSNMMNTNIVNKNLEENSTTIQKGNNSNIVDKKIKIYFKK